MRDSASPSTRSDPHAARQIAESFGNDAERYHRTRPHYPQALVESVLRSAPGTHFLDVGIGTGVSAESFRDCGCEVSGVEPDERMARFAMARGFELEVAKFEEWDPGDQKFDAVIAGQSWHWVDPLAGAAKAASILYPDGLLAVFWNVFSPPTVLAEAFAEVYRREVPDAPFAGGPSPGLGSYAPILTKTANGIRRTNSFSEPEQSQFAWQRTYTTAEWQDQVPTFGGHNLIPPTQMGRLLEGIGSEIEAIGGAFPMDYVTVIIKAQLVHT
jgi:SAM-dependent methyltransferase